MSNINVLSDSFHLVEAEVINDDNYSCGKILLRLKYEGRNKACKYTYELPCIEVPIPTNEFSISSTNSLQHLSRSYVNMTADKCLIRADPIVKVTEEFTKEMTIDQIEKELGYKIKIVGGSK